MSPMTTIAARRVRARSLRTRATLFVVSAALTLLAGCASTPSGGDSADATERNGMNTPEPGSGEAPAVAGPERVNTSTVVMTVEGMSCPMCARNVLKYLTDVEGVNDVSFDLGEGLVTLDTDPNAGLTKAILRDAVWESGFTLRAIELR